MELSFNGGKFVSLESELNYSEVLADFSTAKIIRILTYNISKNQRRDALLDALKNTSADIQIITNVPSRMERYYDSVAGTRMRSAARNNIRIYISKLNPDNFPKNFTPFFNIHNHAKIIGTENIVYIGSANYSNESADNIETGVLIEDKDFIKKLYAEFFDKVREDSLSYFDENFSAFRILVLSLYAKFKYHHHKMLTDLYTDYQRNKQVVSDAVFIDISDLETLYRDLDELEDICGAADNTYDEENENYNDALEQLRECFDNLSIDWLKDTISEDGTLYRLVAFDVENKTNDILETEYTFEAYDENLDIYVEKAMDSASEMYSVLHDAFEEESDDFLREIEKILYALEEAIRFTNKWKVSKINPEIDNT